MDNPELKRATTGVTDHRVALAILCRNARAFKCRVGDVPAVLRIHLEERVFLQQRSYGHEGPICLSFLYFTERRPILWRRVPTFLLIGNHAVIHPKDEPLGSTKERRWVGFKIDLGYSREEAGFSRYF